MMKFIFMFLFIVITTVMKKIDWKKSCLLLIVFLIMMLFMVSNNESFKMMGFMSYLDSMGYSLIILSIFLTILMITSSITVYKFNYYGSLYLTTKLLLLWFLIMTFSVNNLIMFYLFFEASLIPTLLIILGWGYQPERLQAGIYFMMYTLLASLPLLFVLLYLYYETGCLASFMNKEFWNITESINASNYMAYCSFGLGLALIMAFLVKMPMFLVHLWLLKAHVEAPVAGSMILAGVLLKLGGYGLCRVMNLVQLLISKISLLIISLSIVGMVIVGVICCRLNDLKALVAYSSVAHMGLVLCGLFSSFVWGLNGGLMMMVSHGLGSSGLFCIVNMFYERFGSRSIYVNMGVLGILPIFSMMLFFLCCSNISAPPTINLLSEIFLMLSMMSYDYFFMLIFPISSFLGAVFTFYLFSNSQHGKFYSILENFNFYSLNECHTLLLHILPINVLVLSPLIFLIWLD